MNTRKEKPVRNNPGITKEFLFDHANSRWTESGKYRAIRRVRDVDGKSKKEQAMFKSLEKARSFRTGGAAKAETGQTFETLIHEWRAFHYLKLERGTKQSYDRRLPNLDYLKRYPVEEITAEVIDSLVQHWVTEYPKGKRRENFGKELDILKVILRFHQQRKNPRFVIPVFRDHYEASDIAKKAEQPVQSLSQNELNRFFEELKTSNHRRFYPIALAQFCLGLRIGEACGLHWDAIDIENRTAKIEWTIEWDFVTWEARVKEKPKNGKVRMLVIPEVLAEEFKLQKALRDPKVPFLFHQKGKPLNRQVVAKAYNRALKQLGISHVSGTHMLRKTAATIANEITGDFYAVSKLLDHQSPNVTLRYVSQTGVQRHKVAAALNSALAESQTEEKNENLDETKEPPVPKSPEEGTRGNLILINSDR